MRLDIPFEIGDYVIVIRHDDYHDGGYFMRVEKFSYTLIEDYRDNRVFGDCASAQKRLEELRDEKSKEALEALYRKHKAHCCKCGCELKDNIGNGVGAVFVLDKCGRFYCGDCDWCFTEGDERIFDIDEE